MWIIVLKTPRMKKFLLLVSLTFSATLIYFSFMHEAPSIAADGFYKRVRHPLKIIITAKYNSEQYDDFFDSLRGADDKGIFDFEASPSSFSEADVVVWVLHDWSDIWSAPGRDDFFPLFEDASSIKDAEKKTYVLSLKDERPLLAIFYSAKDVNDSSPDCIAKNVFYTAYSEDIGVSVANTCGEKVP